MMPTIATTSVTRRPPQSAGRHRREAELAGQQDEGEDREDDEQVEDRLALVRHPRDRHRDEADDEEQDREIDAPALVERIAAVHERPNFALHEGPAGAGLRAEAGLAVLARPDRVDERPVDDAGRIQTTSSRTTTRQDGVGRRWRRGWRAASRSRRLRDAAAAAAAAILLADVRRCSLGGRSRSSLHQRHARLNQFMKSDVSRLSVR